MLNYQRVWYIMICIYIYITNKRIDSDITWMWFFLHTLGYLKNYRGVSMRIFSAMGYKHIYIYSHVLWWYLNMSKHGRLTPKMASQTRKIMINHGISEWISEWFTPKTRLFFGTYYFPLQRKTCWWHLSRWTSTSVVSHLYHPSSVWPEASTSGCRCWDSQFWHWYGWQIKIVSHSSTFLNHTPRRSDRWSRKIQDGGQNIYFKRRKNHCLITGQTLIICYQTLI